MQFYPDKKTRVRIHPSPGLSLTVFGMQGHVLSRSKAHSGFNSKGLHEHIVCLSNGGTYCRG